MWPHAADVANTVPNLFPTRARMESCARLIIRDGLTRAVADVGSSVQTLSPVIRGRCRNGLPSERHKTAWRSVPGSCLPACLVGLGFRRRFKFSRHECFANSNPVVDCANDWRRDLNFSVPMTRLYAPERKVLRCVRAQQVLQISAGPISRPFCNRKRSKPLCSQACIPAVLSSPPSARPSTSITGFWYPAIAVLIQTERRTICF